MRILLLTDHWAPEIGAPQRRWAWLAAGLVERGHELAVLTPSRPDPARRPRPEHGAEHLEPVATKPVLREATGALVHRTPVGPGGRGLARRAASQAAAAACMAGVGARRFAASHRPEVIIGSVPGLPVLPAALALGRALDRPVVAEMRDAWPDIVSSARHWAPTGRHPAVGSGLETALEHTVAPALTAMQGRAQALVTTTDSFAEVLRARGMGPVVTIRNTARPEEWCLPPVPAHREDAALHVLYLGTVGRAQGLVCAVRAAARAREEGVRLRLRVVGSGAQAELVRREALRLEAPVEVLGSVAHERVEAHYAWADTVLVNLQDWPSMELTVPSKLYEIMAAGRHVSAAVAGETRAVVEQSRCGHAVAPQDPDALARLWADLAVDRGRLRVAAAGSWLRAHADRHQLVERYETLLKEVVGG